MEVRMKQRVEIETDESLGSLSVTGIVTETVESNSGGKDEPASLTPTKKDEVEIESIEDEFGDLVVETDLSQDDVATIKAMLIEAANEHPDDFEPAEDFDDEEDAYLDDEEDEYDEEDSDDEEDDLLDDSDEDE